MLTTLLAVALVAQVEAVEAPGPKGRVVMECAEPLTVLVDGKARGRCGPAALRNLWLPVGKHELGWKNKTGAVGSLAVELERGKSVTVRLPAGTAGEASPAGAEPDEEPAVVGAEPAAATSTSDPSAPASTPGAVATAPSPAPSTGRFTVGGDGTVVDPSSGLMWLAADTYASLHRCVSPYQARTYVQFLRVGGYSDWRLPTSSELKTLLETGDGVTTPDGTYRLQLPVAFGPVAGRWAWTSDELYQASGPNGIASLHLAVVDFANGAVTARSVAGACDGVAVRAVRVARPDSR